MAPPRVGDGDKGKSNKWYEPCQGLGSLLASSCLLLDTPTFPLAQPQLKCTLESHRPAFKSQFHDLLSQIPPMSLSCLICTMGTAVLFAQTCGRNSVG